MGDEVLVSVPGLPDDHLGVEHDEAAEDGQADVQVSLQPCPMSTLHISQDQMKWQARLWYREFCHNLDLEKQLGSEEDVEKAKDEESGESREESAAKIEVLAIRGEQGSAGEASEYGRGKHEGGGHQRGVHHDCHGEEGAQAESSEEGEGYEHGEAGAAVLPVVRGHEQAKGNPSAKEGEDQTSALINTLHFSSFNLIVTLRMSVKRCT